MSVEIAYVVDVESTLEEAELLANQVVADLIRRQIVLPTPQRHEYLTGLPEYATGPNAGLVADYNDCFPCGLSVKVGRKVYDPGGNGVRSLSCRECRSEYGVDDIEWASRVGEWFYGRPAELTCTRCGSATSVADWRFDPVVAFGHLGFAFYNWHLKDHFVEELSELLGHHVAWVKCHI